MGRARALPKAITTSKTGIYYLYGDYPSQILGDPEHKDSSFSTMGPSRIMPARFAIGETAKTHVSGRRGKTTDMLFSERHGGLGTT